jgi:hypothetical protein
MTDRRNMSTQESRDFWAFADACAREVRTWPDWRRAGINVAIERNTADAQDEKEGV